MTKMLIFTFNRHYNFRAITRKFNLKEIKPMPNYDSDAGLASHLQKQSASIDQYSTQAGASAAVVTSIKEDSANTAAILSFSALVE